MKAALVVSRRRQWEATCIVGRDRRQLIAVHAPTAQARRWAILPPAIEPADDNAVISQS